VREKESISSDIEPEKRRTTLKNRTLSVSRTSINSTNFKRFLEGRVNLIVELKFQ
jgi:hypothetical protein